MLLVTLLALSTSFVYGAGNYSQNESELTDFEKPERLEVLEIRACQRTATKLQKPADETLLRQADVRANNIDERWFAELSDEQSLNWCLSIETDKNAEDAARVRRHRYITQFNTTVHVSWYRLDTQGRQQSICTLGFKGFQGNYRLSPDLGHYRQCNHDIGRYHRYLSERHDTGATTLTSSSFTNFTRNTRCPLLSLPSLQSQYEECELTTDRWYIFNFTSTLFVERITPNGSYETQQRTVNEVRPFSPRAITAESGRDWLKRLVRVTARRRSDCVDVFLMILDEAWSYRVDIQLYRKLPQNTTQVDAVLHPVTNVTLSPSDRPWTELSTTNSGIPYQLCANLTSNTDVWLTSERLYCLDVDDVLGSRDKNQRETIQKRCRASAYGISLVVNQGTIVLSLSLIAVLHF